MMKRLAPRNVCRQRQAEARNSTNPHFRKKTDIGNLLDTREMAINRPWGLAVLYFVTMKKHSHFDFCVVIACCLYNSNVIGASLPIDVEVAAEAGAPITAQQEWARLLGRMNLGNVRLRGARGGERPNLEQVERGTQTHYRLLAILNRRNQLVVPERQFHLHERTALQKYFDELPAKTAYNVEDRGRFGLTEKQFRQVFADLSKPTTFSTVGKTPAQVYRQLISHVTVPVSGTKALSLHDSKPLTIELKNLSTGTLLAYVLRHEGLALRPQQLPGEELQLLIAPYDPQHESWPVGWKPAVSSRQSAPQLYELRNVEIEGFTLDQALTALAPAIKVPVVFDQWILEQHKIDPKQVQVSVPKKRTYLKAAIDKMLSQARLSEELRVDEQDQPFLWVTRFGKSSRPAVE